MKLNLDKLSNILYTINAFISCALLNLIKLVKTFFMSNKHFRFVLVKWFNYLFNKFKI